MLPIGADRGVPRSVLEQETRQHGTQKTVHVVAGETMHITFNRIRPTPPKSRRSRRRRQDVDRLRAFLVTAGRHRDHLGTVSVLARGASLRAFVETVCAKMATLGVPASDAAWLRGKLAAGLRRHLGDEALPVEDNAHAPRCQAERSARPARVRGGSGWKTAS